MYNKWVILVSVSFLFFSMKLMQKNITGNSSTSIFSSTSLIYYDKHVIAIESNPKYKSLSNLKDDLKSKQKIMLQNEQSHFKMT